MKGSIFRHPSPLPVGVSSGYVIRLAAIRWHLKLPTFALDDNGR